MEKCLEFLYKALISFGTYLQPVVLLAIRLVWGAQFYAIGADKLENIETVVAFFGQLGIPYPEFSASFVGILEFVGGSCLLIGFASRFFAFALTGTMSVALVTAHTTSLKLFFVNPAELIHEDPFSFFFASLIIFVFGPGLFAVDALLKQRYK